MHLFTDRFMTAFVRNAQRAAAEPDALLRELHMAALAASALARLTASDMFDDGEQKRTAMLVARLITKLGLEVQDAGEADGREDRTES
jgi:hypothetical protein